MLIFSILLKGQYSKAISGNKSSQFWLIQKGGAILNSFLDHSLKGRRLFQFLLEMQFDFTQWNLLFELQCQKQMSKSKSSTLKYLVVGDSGVGKTSLLVRYCDDTFQTEYLTTIGVDFKIKRIEYNGQPITLNIWDTAGQERFRNITKSFYKGAHGIVLTYSITDPNSYLHIEKWVQQIRQTGNADIVMILVGSKADLKDERKVSYKQGEQLADRYGLDFVETSAKEDSNIEEVFKKLTDSVVGKGALDQTKESTTLPLNDKNKKKKKESDCC